MLAELSSRGPAGPEPPAPQLSGPVLSAGAAAAGQTGGFHRILSPGRFSALNSNPSLSSESCGEPSRWSSAQKPCRTAGVISLII